MIAKKITIATAALAFACLSGTSIPLPCPHYISTAYASPLQEINGMLFWHGDMNYPVYDNGNRFCNALDMSSAYIVTNDENELVIAVSDISFSFSDDDMAATNTALFKEDKQSGKASLCHEQSGTCRNVTTKKRLNDVYYYLKCYLQLI